MLDVQSKTYAGIHDRLEAFKLQYLALDTLLQEVEMEVNDSSSLMEKQ